MASSATKLVFSVLLWCLQAFSHCAEEGDVDPGCRPFSCGEKLGNLKFPFCNTTHPKCGFFVVDGCNTPNQTIQLVKGSGKRYDLLDIYPSGIIQVRDNTLQRQLRSNDCRAFNNLSLPNSSFLLSLSVLSSIDMFKCRHGFNSSRLLPGFAGFNYTGCEGYTIYYIPSISKPLLPTVLSQHCSVVQLPVHNRTLNSSHDPFQFIRPEFFLYPQISDYCVDCSLRGRVCRYDSKGRTLCQNIGNGKSSKKLRIAIGSGGAAIFIIMICLVLFIMRRGYRQKTASSGLISKQKDRDASLKSELDTDSAYCGVPIFPYHELEKATNYFDSTRELGDGGFGTVYYGILQDGREVAVKRLYENNYKRVQQFMNEIKILTRLRHKNLVTLYGCTSLHSRELLLVYEFIANGTVADHVHGDRATHTPLAWPVRLRIAAEAANALAYLHASGIIHRDVKTSNILLDNSFSVKVADFGLSRLFPTDATHVSTAPQGTPGYVDPEYHKCYQLTERSDVYSFGVVLIELISSLPAVDISRDKEEINLASLAVNRIQNQEFSEFLDPCLRFESDLAVRKMVVLVAELAFQCLQPDREQRPSMGEVLKTLKSIQGEHDDVDQATESAADDYKSGIAIPMTGSVDRTTPAVPETEDGVLLKGTHSFTSPISVTDTWASRSTISSSSTV